MRGAAKTLAADSLPADIFDQRLFPYDFRLNNRLRGRLLQDKLTPILVERTRTLEGETFYILDGHRRFKALVHREGPKASVPCQIVDASEHSLEDRFQMIVAAHYRGNDPLRLVERARLLRHFRRAGLSAWTIARNISDSVHTVEDCIEVAKAPAVLARMLNRSRLDPSLAAMLVRRHQEWSLSKWSRHADFVARRLLRVADRENLTVKSWRFYLDFYWERDRPSLIRTN